MSSQVSTELVTEPPRRRLTDRQAATVARLTDAATDELREVGYAGLTVRNVARRAGVAPATAYTFFTSKDHLVAEVFWRRVDRLPAAALDPDAPPGERVTTAMTDLVTMIADDPALAEAANASMLAPDDEVRILRDRIGRDVRHRLETALGPGVDPTVLEALDLALAGALLRAGTGHLSFDDLPDRLAAIAGLILGARP